MSSTNTKNKKMTVPEIKIKAKELGINFGKMNKTELIHAIQTAEGNYPCYGWSNGNCQNMDCCFMADCLKIRL
ncbi:MAG: Rho termination factor N-terminal domain-containing protein [Sedimentisphaerales bacterium]|nr:Rho termination factor N-terminal domain-containing protein [Sedimentisphaerales bacterium]